MCGIVGYVGDEQAAPILLTGLSKLEYRGYDSAGIAVRNEATDKIAIVKAKGRLKTLIEKTDGGSAVPGTCGIGHTRWATHGEPSETNAHPHCTDDKSVVLVHNGIIENYQELKAKLFRSGYTFYSQTDTEVAVKLVDYYYKKTGTPLEAISRAMLRIRGSYAFGVIFKDYPGKLFAARKDSPLIIGKSENGSLIASDVPAILDQTRRVYYIGNLEIAELSRDEIHFYNIDREEIEKDVVEIQWDAAAAEKGGYEHFMFKEIMEQPEALRRAILPRIKDGEVVFDGLQLDISRYDSIKIIACGSSYHVGMVGKYNLEKLARIPVEVVLASEFRYCDPIIDSRTLVVVISQSGETLDTMAALREAKSLGARIVSIVNVVGSSIARESDDVLYTWAGPEIAVATTKAYSTQMAVLDLLAIYLAGQRKTITAEDMRRLTSAIAALPAQVEQILSNREQIQYYASQYFNHDSVFFIGRNLDYALGMEGSLKLKEISYIHSEAYASGELKHGTISLIEPGTLVVALGSYTPLFDKAMSNVIEVKARGASVLALATESHRAEMESRVDGILTIPDTELMFLPLLGVVPLQLFAYYVALQRGCDIDKPRNLAKSVTVE